MNIFVVEYDGPIACARSLIDKHVGKLSLEACQMLCSAHWATGSKAPYRLSYKNHPCSKWARASIQNYRWLVVHGLALCDEYTARYNRVHKCQSVLTWLFNHEPILPDTVSITPFALAIKKDLWDQCYVEGDSVASYRNYYRLDKAKFATWKRNKPAWF